MNAPLTDTQHDRCSPSAHEVVGMLTFQRIATMNLLWVLVLIVLIASVTGSPALGVWKHSYGWGPSGIGAVVVIILIVLLLTGRL